MHMRDFGFGGSMKLSVTARVVIFGVFASLVSLSVLGQGLPPGVTPGMVDQLKSMSPAQQQALAKQYGITLPDGWCGRLMLAWLLPVRSAATPMGMTQDDIEAATPDKTEEVEERARTRYGRTLFSRDVSTFAPTDDAPVPESYRLGVGDQLVVQLFGKENDQLNLQIGRSGDISFPKLGAITLSGLTFEDARDLIKTRVEQQLIGVDAFVSMGRLEGHQCVYGRRSGGARCLFRERNDHSDPGAFSGRWRYRHRSVCVKFR